MGNKTVTASIDEKQLDAPYAAVKEVRALADKRMHRILTLLGKSSNRPSEKAREAKRS